MPVVSQCDAVRDAATRRRSDAVTEAPVAASPRRRVAPDVSVCIVNWNCRDLLRHCLLSLRDQCSPAFDTVAASPCRRVAASSTVAASFTIEVIVVDNASQDGAADMVAAEFPEVTLIRNTANAGFARGNNQAAQHARGRYLFFLNNDTILPPGAIRELFDYAEEHPDVGIVGPALRDASGQRQVSHRLQPTLSTFLHRTLLLRWTNLLRPAYHCYRRQASGACERPGGVTATRPIPVEVLMGAALFMRRQVFETCGRWDEDFLFGGEDLEFCHRVRRTHPLMFLPEVEITHLGRASTRLNIGFAHVHIAAGFARYLRKIGYSSLAILLFKLIITLDAPYHMIEKWLQFLYRAYYGRNDEAAKSLLVARGLMHLLTRGLVTFWTA